MLYQVEGDILLSRAQVIAHGVAPDDHFTQGLALALRKEYPAMAKDFRHYCKTTHPKPGELWVWGGADGRRVVNLMTQEAAASKNAHPGKASLHNIRQTLRHLAQLIDAEQFTSVALPRLATGVGGLSWDEVLPVIEQHLGDKGIPVFVYGVYHAGVQADEPTMTDRQSA